MKPSKEDLLKDPNRAVGLVLAETVELCANCGARLLHHEYSLLATLAITKNTQETKIKFFEAVKDHQWAILHEFQDWHGADDDIEAYLIRCSKRNLSVAVLKTHFELLQPARLLYTEVLTAGEGGRLLDTFPNLKWHAV